MTINKWHPGGLGAASIPSRPLTPEELSQHTGESLKRLEKWRAAGVIGGENGYSTDDVGKARLVHELLHYGHPLEEIREAFARPDSVLRYFLEGLAHELSRQMYSIAESAELTGLDLDQLRRIVDATGVATTGELLDEEDVKYLQSCKVAMDAGYPEEGLTQILRVYADAMSRAAEVSQRTSHFYLHQPAKSELPPEEVMGRLNETFSRIEPLVEPALLYFFRKGAQAAVWDDLLMHLEEQSGLEEPSEAPGQIRRAVMFVDLASFTPLAEAMGDARAAAVLDRFGEIVRKAVRRCHGRTVKQIGDGFMIVFPECFSAVSCGLELEEQSSVEPSFPAVRIGLHFGSLLYHEGDYVGSNVNIAARLAADAQRHQFLVTDEVRRRAKEYEPVEFVRASGSRAECPGQYLRQGINRRRWTMSSTRVRDGDRERGNRGAIDDGRARLRFLFGRLPEAVRKGALEIWSVGLTR
jgi:adenylate cyclase